MAEKQAQISELKTQRASTKGCITRIKNLVEQKAETLTYPELECRLGILESYFKQILSYQTSIENLLPGDATEANVRGDLEELYCAAKSKLLSLMSGVRKTSVTYEPGTKIIVANASGAGGNLPKLRLPQFAGKYSEYPNFHGCFMKLVHQNESLSKLEKFNHLLSCLSGAALRTIKAFEVTEDNYEKALKRLQERYDNKYLIFQEHVVDLFNLPKVTKNSASQLRSLTDSTNAHLSSLESLGKAEDIVNAFLIYIVNSKLDAESQAAWEEKLEFSKLPSWNDCANSLIRRCQYLESRETKLHSVDSSNSVTQGKKGKHPRSASANLTSLAAAQSVCTFCNQSAHVIYKCPEFKKIPVADRLHEVKKRALCLNCLFKGHSVKNCSVRRCRVCSLPHHTLLHRYSTNSRESVPDIAPEVSQEQVKVNEYSDRNGDSLHGSTALQTLHMSEEGGNNHVFLATAIVKIKDRSGNYHFARALLDSASQLNFITESLAQTLKLKRDKVETSITGIGATSSKVRYSTQAAIQSRVNKFEINLQFYILSNITGGQPERKIIVEDWKIPANIQLADPCFFEPQKVDLLLGADHFFQLLCVGQIQLGDNLPTLQKTLLGWIVSGRCSDLLKYQTPSCSLALDEEKKNATHLIQDESLSKIVEKFWEEESVVLSKPAWNEEHTECERIFSSTFQRLPNGRFMVKLPFKKNPGQELGNSWERAKDRLRYLERRLNKYNQLKIQYSEFLREYLSSGHMERISRENIPSSHYFMPHQYVLRPESSTTKLRVVFDASTRTTSNKSLNDLLMVGPTIQEDIVSIMLRFRYYKFALIADISAMYRQILVAPEDRNFQLILWRENPSDDVQVFRLNTVTYGTASAPFLATRCLVQLADEYLRTMPEASRVIKRDFYMDDLITGADTSEEIYRIREDVENILCSAQFKLRKWYSNDKKLLSEIPEADREKPLRINDLDIIKTLGIVWEPDADEFRFHFKHAVFRSSKTTKRTILSDVARLFDPLGLINPVVVKAKVFLQELWILKLHWDESIPQELEWRWRDYINDLAQLQELKIPRCVVLAEDKLRTEIHGFSDASTRAYGCCIYLRCIYASGAISVMLLTAKSKVAPIRTVRSLPCLELCAALLLAKLLDKTLSSLSKPYDKIYLWTDSGIVLDWLACHPSTWKTFVANRVSEIQGLTADATWRHVNSKANPADIISRGCRVTELSESMWFCGPEFLQRSPDTWPTKKDRNSSNTTLERRQLKSILVCTVSAAFLEDIYSLSDFSKNCRRFAWILRFFKNVKAKRERTKICTGPLSASEIEDAFSRIIWAIQQREFAEEFLALENKTGAKLKDGISKLNPFLDESTTHKFLRRRKIEKLQYTLRL